MGTLTPLRQRPRTAVRKPGQLIIPNRPLGPNVVINGHFSTDAVWIKGVGWDIVQGLAVCDGTQLAITELDQPGILSGGVVYEATYDVVDYSVGLVHIIVGAASGTVRSADGTYTQRLTAISSAVVIQGDASFVGKIDNVVVRKVNYL